MEWNRKPVDLETALSGYVETALWLAHCYGDVQHDDCRGENCDSGLDDLGFDYDDVAESAIEEMRTDVTNFIESCAAERPNCFDTLPAESIGHNFYLDRNGHGTGFWDRGLGELGDWLSKQCEPYGDDDLYVGDDGKVYHQ